MAWTPWWRREAPTEPTTEPAQPSLDPVEHMRSTDNPRLHALADEIERGRDRQKPDGCAPDPDDAYWRAQDAALLRMMKGCTFAEGVTLPSGRFITGAEAELWQEIER